mmetsp:Transcript_1375/g.5909  ORF Transcript_1375/g.5909 Transcript_1375/m.5909 type:complete len:286 (+) Transcript_1375:316-1173(+)
MLSKTVRPQSTALTIEAKLSSRITMSDASFATSVPHKPMLSPTSPAFNAGASFVPSPVTPTTSPTPFGLRGWDSHSARWPGNRAMLSCSQLAPGCASSHSSWVLGRLAPFNRDTRMSLSCGEERARTCSRGRMSSTWRGVSRRNSGPSIARPPGVKMPHFFAIAIAVFLLSPVTIRTAMPQALQVATAAVTSGRRGSRMPRTASTHKACSNSSAGPRTVPEPVTGDFLAPKSLCATMTTRSARSSKDAIVRRISSRMPAVSAVAFPVASVKLSERLSTISDAPFT